MKKAFLLFVFAFTVFTFAPDVRAQKKDNTQKVENPLETDAKHNLEVSRQYFKLKKAYKAVKLRLDETVAAYPEFSKMDEVLYLLGMSNFYLSEGRGKQELDFSKMTDDEKRTYTAENLRDEAVTHLTDLVNKYPKSKFKKDAEKTLKLLQDKK